ncbi:MAG: DUF1963 domain-containing protein [Mesorhizobium sp.]|nr:MAG: DUF1963 domain-containing protein [Mesorhizobium sp.]
MITGHVGELPPPKGWRKGKAPGFPDPRDARPPDLSDAAFHPFDEATLKVFLDNVQEHFSRQKMRIDAFLRTKLRGEDKTKLETMQLGATRSMERFLQVVEALAPFTRDFQPEPVQDLLKQITGIPSHHVRRLNDDEDGYVVLKSSILPMSEKPDPSFGSSWHYYADRLYRHAVCAYTQAPETLPPALRARMETIWRFEAPYEAGAMGHAPIGHVYTPHGPGTSNVVLLELPTSDMAGWIWGDMYSIVLFINRNDLAHGNFSKVTFEITN